MWQQNEALASAFAGLPPGLKVAAALMRSKNCTPSTFLKILGNVNTKIERFSIAASSRTLENVRGISLNATSPEAADLLDLQVLVDPDNIPMDLFERNLLRRTSASAVNLEFLNAVGCLSNHSLINVNHNTNSLSLHRYFHNAMFQRLEADSNRIRNALLAVVEHLRLVVPEEKVGITPERWPST